MDKGLRRNLVKKHMDKHNKPRTHRSGIDYKRKDKYVKTITDLSEEYCENRSLSPPP